MERDRHHRLAVPEPELHGVAPHPPLHGLARAGFDLDVDEDDLRIAGPALDFGHQVEELAPTPGHVGEVFVLQEAGCVEPQLLGHPWHDDPDEIAEERPDEVLPELVMPRHSLPPFRGDEMSAPRGRGASTYRTEKGGSDLPAGGGVRRRTKRQPTLRRGVARCQRGRGASHLSAPRPRGVSGVPIALRRVALLPRPADPAR